MEKYLNVELEVIEFNTEDVICTSNQLPKAQLSFKPYEVYEQYESNDED